MKPGDCCCGIPDCEKYFHIDEGKEYAVLHTEGDYHKGVREDFHEHVSIYLDANGLRDLINEARAAYLALLK